MKKKITDRGHVIFIVLEVCGPRGETAFGDPPQTCENNVSHMAFNFYASWK